MYLTFFHVVKKPAGDSDLVQAQSTNLISSSAPPKEKKPKLDEVLIFQFCIK